MLFLIKIRQAYSVLLECKPYGGGKWAQVVESDRL